MKCLDTDLLVAILRGKREALKTVEALDEESKGTTTTINASNSILEQADQMEKMKTSKKTRDYLKG